MSEKKTRTSWRYLHNEFKAALEALYGPQPAVPPTEAPDERKSTFPRAVRNAGRDARSAGIKDKKLTSKWDFHIARGIFSSAMGPSGSSTPAFSTRPSSRLWALVKVETTSVSVVSFALDPMTIKKFPVDLGGRRTYHTVIF